MSNAKPSAGALRAAVRLGFAMDEATKAAQLIDRETGLDDLRQLVEAEKRDGLDRSGAIVYQVRKITRGG